MSAVRCTKSYNFAVLNTSFPEITGNSESPESSKLEAWFLKSYELDKNGMYLYLKIKTILERKIKRDDL